MQISETRIKLVEKRSDRLKAFCSITFDDSFVIRDLKIIEGSSGLFVAMPSRKLTDHCPSCGNKNYLTSRYCSECGMKMDENRINKKAGGRLKLHADIAHPINAHCRDMIQKHVIDAYHNELEHSKKPGYRPPSLDYEDDSYAGRHLDSKSEPRTDIPPVENPPKPESGSSDFSEGIL